MEYYDPRIILGSNLWTYIKLKEDEQMGIIKKTEENETVKVECRVVRARAVSETAISFDMVANGISIYGCWYREGVKDGREWSMITFPSYKGSDGKYYNQVYFKVTDDIKEDLVKQIESLL